MAARVLSPAVPVLMLHRFSYSREGPGLAAPRLRELLELALRRGVRFVPLREVLSDAAAGRAMARGTACLTVDDGYRDFLQVAVPQLVTLGVPATVFVVTEFVEGRCWMWWDQVERALAARASGNLRLGVGARTLDLSLASSDERHVVTERAVGWIKTLPDGERRLAIRQLADRCGLDLSLTPPDCAAMTWDEVRACVAQGMDVGPHTRTHPILSHATDAEAEREIGGSWEELRAELPEAIPVFAYPNGMRDDFGEREMRLVANAGLEAALSSSPGYVTASTLERARYALPRFAFETSSARLLQVITGFERVKSIWR